MSVTMWDERYGGNDYAYGREPNEFLRAEAARIPPGRVLCIAEGEGRNAVYLAGLGYAVTAVDFSAAGLRKAARLATERGVKLDLVEADLSTYVPQENAFSSVVSIFAHLPTAVRQHLYPLLTQALLPGGVLVLEAYSQKQLQFGTGGPKDPSMLPSLNELKAGLLGLEFVVAREVERDVSEGTFHTGLAATIQIVAQQPQ